MNTNKQVLTVNTEQARRKVKREAADVLDLFGIK